MSIDKAIAKIWHCIVSIRDCEGNKEFVIALEYAVDIMRKYLKIIKIMNELKGDFYSSYLNDRQTLEKIYEVMEERGNNET